MCSMIYTCDLLLWQSHRLGTRDYETLSQAIGGRPYRIFTEVKQAGDWGDGSPKESIAYKGQIWILKCIQHACVRR